MCSQDPLKEALNDLLAEVGDDRELDEPIATYLCELVDAGANQDQLVAFVAGQLTIENPTAAAEQIVGELQARLPVPTLLCQDLPPPADAPQASAFGFINIMLRLVFCGIKITADIQTDERKEA